MRTLQIFYKKKKKNFAHKKLKKTPQKVAYLWQLGGFFLGSPDCPKQPRTSFQFYKLFYPTISGKISEKNTFLWLVVACILWNGIFFLHVTEHLQSCPMWCIFPGPIFVSKDFWKSSKTFAIFDWFLWRWWWAGEIIKRYKSNRRIESKVRRWERLTLWCTWVKSVETIVHSAQSYRYRVLENSKLTDFRKKNNVLAQRGS